jgi:adenylyl-sulfate kinase
LKGFVLWFTGLSGSGKSTLATLVAAELRARGTHVEVLDGDDVRTHLSKGLGFSREDRDTNVRRVGFVAKLLARAGACAITAAISPYRDVRDEQRRNIEHFVEVYCKCSLETLERRDPKGLYEKARKGEIENFTGVSAPYEEPLTPDVELDTSSLGKAECVARVVGHLEEAGYLARQEAGLVSPYGEKLTPVPIPSGAPSFSLPLPAREAALTSLVASGLLAPLRGPLNDKDAKKLAKEGRLESGIAWPVSYTVALPDGADPKPGDIVRLEAMPPVDLVVDSVWSHASADATPLGPPQRFVAGELVPGGDRPVDRIRAAITVIEIERAAGVVLRREIDAKLAFLLSCALESCGELVLLCAGALVVQNAQLFVERRGLESSCLVVRIPEVPVLEPKNDALLQAILIRNAGLRFAVLDAAHGHVAPSPREALAGYAKSEIGIEIVASGPVIEIEPGQLGTLRMGSVRTEAK